MLAIAVFRIQAEFAFSNLREAALNKVLQINEDYD